MEESRVQLERDGENHMEIVDIQQVFPLSCEPPFFGEGLALGAMAVAAGIVRDSLVAAMAADINVSSQSRRAAQDDASGGFPLLGRRLALRRVILKMGGEDVLDFSHLFPPFCRQGLRFLSWCWRDAGKSW